MANRLPCQRSVIKPAVRKAVGASLAARLATLESRRERRSYEKIGLIASEAMLAFIVRQALQPLPQALFGEGTAVPLGAVLFNQIAAR